MYRGPSPIFDVPEFPPLRRVKPLPKRRRTSIDPTSPLPDTSQYAQAEGIIPGDAPVDMSSFGLNMPLPQYYMPIFNGVQDLFRMGTEDRPLEYPGGFAVPVGAADEEDHGDGDYVDHLQQPGNTKKRKVPAAHHSTTDLISSPNAVVDDDPDERLQSIAVPGRTDVVEASNVGPPLPPPLVPPLWHRKNRSSAATMAGLQHKELLKSRKRQLAAVLGALSHGDTLALDQALSARYSNNTLSGQHKPEGKENEPEGKLRRRSGKHKVPVGELLPARDAACVVPTCEFTFSCPSPTSERLISTREEVAVLHSRFEAELSRQATKAAEAARQNALADAENEPTAKRGDRLQQQQRSRTAGTIAGPNSNDSASATGAKLRTSKKKKRSALANASNPHHLRNYVPSRIPHSGVPPANQGVTNNSNNSNQNLVSPPAVRFLAAEIAPRRRKKSTRTTAAPAPAMAPLEEEWICAFCEYNLFYGEEPGFRRAVRSRKKILSRRRRARERAAAAANGQKNAVGTVDTTTTTTTTTTTDSFDSHVEEEYGVDAQHGPVKRGTGGRRDKPDKQGQ